MRKRIGQIARGKIEYVIPEISFSEKSLELKAYTDADLNGSFTITCANDRELRGIVYSSHERMECLTPQFGGAESMIRYRFHSNGVQEGETWEGEFVIVADGTVARLPFYVSAACRYPSSSIGEIKNLYDFTNLAKANWSEAYKLFYHNNFRNLIRPKEFKEAMIYKGFLAAKPSDRNMEEYLVGINKKSRIKFRLDCAKCAYGSVTQDQRESIGITREGWGFFDFLVSADADFIEPVKDHIGPEDFLGNHLEFDFILRADRLHPGKNYGRIIFEDLSERKVLEIEARGEEIPEEERSERERRRKIREYKVSFMEFYQMYRLKQVVTGVWVNEAVEILDHLIGLDPEEPIYALQKAQAFIINRQRQEAEWILDDFKRKWTDHRAPIWGYYLYLLTLMEREPAYVDKMTREIEAIQRENEDSALLFWVLSFLEEQYYNNSAKKLEAIRRWVMDGNVSPYLYVEAYYLFCQDPYLLNHLGGFEMRILRWAVKNHAINRDIAIQIFELIGESRQYSENEYRLICAAYDKDPTPEHAGLICGYLIKGQKYETRFHPWYKLGIELELRITNLYEAYLMSMDEHEISNIPKIIQMYFQYESRLPYRKMAVLYNNIVAAKKESPEIYNKYRTTMSKFAMEQVEREHIDDNLAKLYTEMLDLGLVNTEIARHLSRILFIRSVTVRDRRFIRVWVYQRQTKEAQIVPLVDQKANIQLFSNEYVLLFEDAKGNRFVGDEGYELRELLSPDPYLEKCMKLAPEELPYIIRRFDTRQSYLNFTEDDERYFGRIIYSKSLSDEYRGQIIPEILRYYHIYPGRLAVEMETKDEAGSLFSDYLEEVDAAYLSEDARRFYVEMLVDSGLYEKAWTLLLRYGTELLSPAGKEKLAVAMIEKSGMNGDEFLTRLVYRAYREGKSTDKTMEYLCRFYNGPSENMIQIWKDVLAHYRNHDEEAAGIEEIEERVLSQMLFSGERTIETESLFLDYCERGAEGQIVTAYLTVWADDYFIHDRRDGGRIIRWIRERYLAHVTMNDSCKLALLKSIADTGNSGGEDYRIADELLSEFTSRNIIFHFYKKLNRSLIQKYHLYDKVILEYRTRPGRRVTIHYSRDEDGTEFIAEDMLNAYNGIYVKQFVMFFGEIIQYYISEEKDGQIKMSQSNRLANHDVYNQKDESRYSLINQMLMSATLREEESLKRYMLRYQELDEMTGALFKTL